MFLCIMNEVPPVLLCLAAVMAVPVVWSPDPAGAAMENLKPASTSKSFSISTTTSNCDPANQRHHRMKFRHTTSHQADLTRPCDLASGLGRVGQKRHGNVPIRNAGGTTTRNEMKGHTRS